MLTFLKCMSQLTVSLSTPSNRLQIPLERLFGSIGTTRVSRYTLLPRLKASLSRASPDST